MCQREALLVRCQGGTGLSSGTAGFLHRHWGFMVRRLFQASVQQVPEAEVA